MWQQVAVYSVGVLVAAYIVVAVCRLVARRNDPCAGCQGCGLKNALDPKRQTHPRTNH